MEGSIGSNFQKELAQQTEGMPVEMRSKRVRVCNNPAFLAFVNELSPEAIDWINVGIPEHSKVLLDRRLDAFINIGYQAVRHEGIALEEVIVPFVQITREVS